MYTGTDVCLTVNFGPFDAHHQSAKSTQLYHTRESLSNTDYKFLQRCRIYLHEKSTQLAPKTFAGQSHCSTMANVHYT